MWRFSPVSSAWEEVDESSIHQLCTPEHDRSKPDHGTCGCLDAFRCSCVSAASLNFLPSGLTINCKPNNILPYYISCKKRNRKISKSWKAPISASQLCFDFLAWRHLGQHLRRRSVGDTVIWKFETTSSSWWSFPLVVLIRRRGTNFDAPTSCFHTNTPSPDPIRMTCTFIGIEPGQPADHSASIVLTRLSWWSCKSHSKLPLNENRSFIRSGQNVKVMCFMDLLQLPHSCSVLGFKFQSEVAILYSSSRNGTPSLLTVGIGEDQNFRSRVWNQETQTIWRYTSIAANTKRIFILCDFLDSFGGAKLKHVQKLKVKESLNNSINR